MADEKDKPPVTDSRFPGFNPEVEQSHEAELKRLELEAVNKAADEPSAPPPPTYTHRCTACGGLFEKLIEPCPACGASASMEPHKTAA
jgi:rubrerythrin